MSKKGFGVSPLTNTIYYGTYKCDDGFLSNDNRDRVFTGNKVDVTDEVIAVVFEWFMYNTVQHCNGEDEMYRVTYPNVNYELIMRKKNDGMEVVREFGDAAIEDVNDVSDEDEFYVHSSLLS